MMNDWYVIGAGLAIAAAGLWLWIQSRRPVVTAADERELFAGVSLEPQPLFSEGELSLYNLLKVAVQDRYLVLARVPVWGLARIQAADPTVRARLLKKVALRAVDFVLVHPGTRMVKQVVLLDGKEDESDEQRRRDHLVGAVLKATGISVVRLNLGQLYSVSGLATALGLDPIEDA